MKFLLKHKWFLLAQTLMTVAAFQIHNHEVLSRVNNAWGGEVFLIIMPAIFYVTYLLEVE